MPHQVLNRNDAIVVGWREWFAFPDLPLPAIKAKIDTGARTTCIHATNIRLDRHDQTTIVRFDVAPLREHSHFLVHCSAPLVDERYVTDSGGHRTLRPFIRTSIDAGGTRWPIEISLADRRKMKFPMLLGRTAMHGRVLVNPEESYLLGKNAPHVYRQQLPKPVRGTVA